MGLTFTGGEVLFIAMQIEQGGAKVYRGLAGRYPLLASLYGELAGDEEEHYQVFSGLWSGAGDAAMFYDDEEARAYLDRLAGSYVFKPDADPMAAFAGAGTPQQVLAIATGMEQESIALYEALLKTVARPGEQRLIKRIIAEERKHIAALAATGNAL